MASPTLHSDSVCGSKNFKENRVTVSVNSNHCTPEKAKPFYNPKMTVCREFVLATVGVLCRDHEEAGCPVHCLDAFGASGIAGLQWKTHFKDRCHVTITERDETCIQNIMNNCISNSLMPKPFMLEFTRVVGLPLEDQQQREVFVKQCDANVMLHMESFDFIHLDPYGCPVKYMSAAFTNVKNNGVMCIVATDLGSLYAKHEIVALRNYAAYTIKTEYLPEAAARLIAASAVRAAAVCNKGLEILYTVCREHFVLVCVRVRRGPAFADLCVKQIRKVLHCQICEERVPYPDSRAAVENPYDLLSCSCNKNMPGKTAKEIGPFWCGRLYSTEMVMDMYKFAVKKPLSRQIITLLSTMVLEAACPDSVSEHSELMEKCNQIMTETRTNEEEDHCWTSKEANVECKSGEEDGCMEITTEYKSDTCNTNAEETQISCDSRGDACSRMPENLSENSNSDLNTDRCKSIPEHQQSTGSKRSASLKDLPCKKATLQRNEQKDQLSDETWPLFYYDLHKRNLLPDSNLPKTSHGVTLLQGAGYRASRTHFNSTAVRTSANLSQFKEVLWNSKALQIS